MSNLLISSLQEVEQIENLLAKELPNYRKAYSDRTAWLMAFLSEIAYIKFNPVFKNRSKKQLLDLIEDVTENKNLKSLTKLLATFDYDPQAEIQKLVENAELLKLTLNKTFDHNGTQAILLSSQENVFLAFRGTEPNQIKDLKADIKAIIKQCDSGGRIHTGFDTAFSEVAIDIQQELNKDQYKDKPLYITGHSLGGALATIAAKKLTHKAGLAACYTFGSPRVGNEEWVSDIKVPIYRIVNAFDPVTQVPFSGTAINLITAPLKWIPKIGNPIKDWLLFRFGDYMHCGNMRYLTDCNPGDHESVKLLYKVAWSYRVSALFKFKRKALDIPADHSITVYRSKLKIIAMRRNGL